MSTLVRSLLALAGLFATAATQFSPPTPSPNCAKEIIGYITPYENPVEPIHLLPPGGIVDTRIINTCRTELSGAEILACNDFIYGQPPLISNRPGPDFYTVEVDCTDGCPLGVTVYIMEYCGPE